MALSTLFKNLPKTVFGIAGDLARPAIYSVTADDGFGSAETNEYTLNILPSKFTQADRQTLPYGSIILPTDIKGLVGTYSISVKIEPGNYITYDSNTFRVEELSTNAANALYIILLRKF